MLSRHPSGARNRALRPEPEPGALSGLSLRFALARLRRRGLCGDMADLFEAAGHGAGVLPLAEALRPRTPDEVAGRGALLGPESLAGRMLAGGQPASLILWGPAGCGKTTVARLLAAGAGGHLEQLTAVLASVADLRRCFDRARERAFTRTGRTFLLVDEIHRFNRAQQDSFLPCLEDGTVILIGATTENPSFALNSALLSRCHVVPVPRLDDGALEFLLRRAEAHCGHPLPVTPGARALLRRLADGDGRALLNMVEHLLATCAGRARKDTGGGTGGAAAAPLGEAALGQLLSRRAPAHDRDRDGHYDLASALHKSLRASDVDASLYWLQRMLVAGEDPRHITRRLVRFASEDIGLADPDALPQALAAADSYRMLGSPEGELAIAQAVVYLAAAHKSDSVLRAFSEAREAVLRTGSLPPRMISLNAPTALMREMGRGRDYRRDHDCPDGFSGQNHFPRDMARERYYRASGRGAEADIGQRVAGREKGREP